MKYWGKNLKIIGSSYDLKRMEMINKIYLYEKTNWKLGEAVGIAQISVKFLIFTANQGSATHWCHPKIITPSMTCWQLKAPLQFLWS